MGGSAGAPTAYPALGGLTIPAVKHQLILTIHLALTQFVLDDLQRLITKPPGASNRSYAHLSGVIGNPENHRNPCYHNTLMKKHTKSV
jgi:hypothetical protein